MQEKTGKIKLFLSILTGVCVCSTVVGAQTPVTVSSTVSSVGTITSPAPEVKVDGLIQLWYLADQNPGQDLFVPLTVPNAFKIERTEIKFSGKGAKDISWVVMIDPARAIGTDETTNETKRILQDVILTWKPCPNCDLKVMQGKIPFGREGLLPSGELPFVERAAMTTVLKWATVRDLGAMATGSTDIFGPKLTAQAGLFQGQGQNAADTNYVKDTAVRLTADIGQGMHLGLARYEGRLGVGADYAGSPASFNFRTGYELGATIQALTLESEYAAGNVLGMGRQTGYGDLIYSLDASLDLLCRYDWFIMNDSNWTAGQQHEAVFGVNWYVDPQNKNLTKLQFNYAATGPDSPFGASNDLQGRLDYQVMF